MKKQNGITLIALIITIIVMLILIGVSVTVALNGGLFKTAQDAKTDTLAEREREELLAITLGALNEKGEVDVNKLTTALNGTQFDYIGISEDGKFKIKSNDTGKIYEIDKRGSITKVTEEGNESGDENEPGSGVTLTWTHEDVNSNETLDVGEVVTASNGESFYVIETPVDNTIKLLAAKCVNTSTWKQDDNYNTVAFDEGEWNEDEQEHCKPGTTTPVTDVYANASIKGLVETYVTETLGLEANQGRLMLEDEATALQSARTDILYGTTPNWNYWIDYSFEYDGAFKWIVYYSSLSNLVVDCDTECGLRPVIEISKSAIIHSHTGGTATCQQRAVCTECNQEYGSLAEHTGGTATCQQRAVCTECNQEYGSLGEHAGGTATCQQRAVCTECNQEYGSLEHHNTSNGTCTVCGSNVTVIESEHEPYANDMNNVTLGTWDYSDAQSVTITITYQTENTAFDWVCLKSGDNYIDLEGNITSSEIKIGDSEKITKTFTTSALTGSVIFTTDVSVNDFYGVYVTVTPNY